jgi:hypothetical protein
MPKPKEEEVQKFIRVLEDAGYEPKSYSGRGMYGKECVSVSGDDEDGNPVTEWDVALSLWFAIPEDEQIHVPAPRRDQLGRGIVLYWPEYEWPEDEQEEA